MFVRMCVRMCVCHCVFIAFSFKGSNAIFLYWTTWLVGKKSKKRKSGVLLRTYNQHGHRLETHRHIFGRIVFLFRSETRSIQFGRSCVATISCVFHWRMNSLTEVNWLNCESIKSTGGRLQKPDLL